MGTRLSIIIPGYETPEWMWSRCIGSVLAATTDEDEIICVDDGSRISKMPEFGERRIVELRLDKNSGQSHARNLALKQAKGEWITFVDSDDEVLGDVYSYCLDVLSATGDDIAVFGVRTIWADIGLAKDDLPPEGISGAMSARVVKELFAHSLFEYPCNKVYRHEFLSKHGMEFDSAVCPGEDTIFNIDALMHGATLSTVPCLGYNYYRADGTSLSRYLPNVRESRAKYCKAWACLRDKYEDGRQVLSGIGNMSERALDAAEWSNIWRRGSPFSLQERRSYARRNGFSFAKMLLRAFCRRFLYIRPLRRIKIMRTYSHVYSYRKDNVR